MEKNLRHSYLKGVKWSSLEHVLKILLSVAQIAITSRILTALDFGVYSIVTFFSTLGTQAFSMGLSAALIYKRDDITRYYDTAFTASVSIATFATFILIAISPLICSGYFHSSTAILPSIVTLFVLPVCAAKNPASIVFIKELNLKSQFLLEMVPRIAGFILTIVAVFFLKSYWGIICALIFEKCALVAMSYIMVHVRPHFRFNWSQFKELYTFSGWIQLKNVVTWLSGFIDVAIVGNLLPIETLGVYNRAQSISALPQSVIVNVVNTVSFPLYAKVDEADLQSAVHSTSNVLIMLVSTIVLFVTLASDLIVNIVLGNKWLSVSFVFVILVVSNSLQGIVLSFNTILRARGFTRMEFLFQTCKILTMVLLLYPLTSRFGIVGAALAILISVTIALPIMFYLTKKYAKVKVGGIVGNMLLSGLGIGLLIWLYSYVPLSGNMFVCAIATTICVSLYFILFYTIARCFGRGPGKVLLHSVHKKESGN